MKQILRNGLPFLLILALLLGSLSLLFFPKGNALEDGIQEPELYAFLAEGKNSLDVVALGDSIPLCSLVPAYLWRDWGIPGYVCASTAQKLSESIRVLELFLSRQSPRVVLLETDQLYLQESVLDALTVRAEVCFPVLRYHNNWKFVRPNQMFQRADYGYTTPEKGYHLRKLVKSYKFGDYMLPTDSMDPPSSLSLFQVKKIRELCGKNGAQLVLYTAPNAASWNMSRHNAMAALAQELEVPYLDGNLELEDINWKSDTLDGGEHMNIWGAEKVTSWLGGYLASTGLCPDRRESQGYAHWEEALAEFDRRVEDPENWF